jgi:methyl-accepting chemotaxis protein
VGTTLAKGPAYDAVFSRGESYRGPVDILGERYYAAYDPLKDKAGQVVGVLYVGLKKDDLFRSFDHSMMLASGGTVLLVVQQFSMRLSRVCIVRRCWRCGDLARDHERGFSQTGET